MRALHLALALALASSPAQAADPEHDGAPQALAYDLSVDVPLAGGAAAAWLTLELLQPHLAPDACRWCAPGGLDSTARAAMRWGSPGTAHKLSSLTAYGLVPVSTLGLSALGSGLDDGGHRVLVDALVVAEAVALAAVGAQGVKYVVARRRPYVTPTTPASDADQNLSFYSGHTAFAFAATAAATTVAVQRGYKTATWVALAGAVLATSTGYLRIAADRHYLTDVLMGAAIGTGAGVGLPLLLHPVEKRPRVRSVWVVPAPGGAALIGTF